MLLHLDVLLAVHVVAINMPLRDVLEQLIKFVLIGNSVQLVNMNLLLELPHQTVNVVLVMELLNTKILPTNSLATQ